VTNKEIDLDLEERQWSVGDGKTPLKAKAADRLEENIEVILSLMEDDYP
jgi:hypothetical protein